MFVAAKTMELIKHCLIFLCLISTCYGDEESITECIPMSQCDQLQWISNHRQVLPTFDLNQLGCGMSFSGEPNVFCEIDTTIEYLNPSTAMATRTGVQGCRGYVKIHYLESETRLRVIKLKRKIRKIARKQFYRVAVNGNCCWR